MAQNNNTIKLDPVRLNELTPSLSELHTYSMHLPTGFVSARIYISFGHDHMPVKAVLDPADPILANIRYDWVELTYNGDPADYANLTAVEQFGIPMMLQTYKNKEKIQSVGYKDSHLAIREKLYKINSNSFIGGYGSDFVRALSPIKNSSWRTRNNYNKYLSKIKGQHFEIKGEFHGSMDAAEEKHSPCKYDYTGTFEYPKNIVLVPQKECPMNQITISGGESLINIINACDGTFMVKDRIVKGKDNEKDSISFNDQYSAVVRDFVTGFNLGFYGYKDVSADFNEDTGRLINKLCAIGHELGVYDYKTDCINYNDEANWWSDKIFAGRFGNLYVKTIYPCTNAYSFPFTDFMGKQNVSLDPAKVDTLLITIIKDTDTGGFIK